MERVLVGVDGSESARAALRWAHDLAARHGATVVALLAWSYLDQHHVDDVEFDAHYGEDDARAALRAAIAGAELDGAVEERVVCELPDRALIDGGRDADLVVVGARGLGGFQGLLLGSVSVRVLEQSATPVAVVRQESVDRATRPVVVGIDGSPTSTRALHWAAREATARGAALRVVHAWQMTYVPLPPTGTLATALEGAAQQILDDAVADPALEGLRVDARLETGGAAEALIGAADDASMIVAGSRGLGRFGRVLLGSTSRQLAHHAPCPVVVVPPAD